MSARRVRIVVGEGRSSRQGLLRFVLTGEGYDVVGEAGNPAELARILAVHKPDVVVLDDGIGATTVGMVRDMQPGAKLILIWPEAVSPIGGAARVEPSQVLQDLGPTVERLTGVGGVSVAGEGPAAVERAKNDHGALRRMLGTAGVIDLAAHARGSSAEPSAGTASASGSTEPIIDDREPAPVVILPVTPSVDDDEGVLRVPDAGEDAEADPKSDRRAGAAVLAAGAAAGAVLAAGATADAAASEAGTTAAGAAAAGEAAGGETAAGTAAAAGTTAAAGAQSTLNRRLGNVALAGAAVAGAMVFALAVGGAEVPISGVSGESVTIALPTDPTDPPDVGGDNGGPGGGGDDGGGGTGQPGSGDDQAFASFYPIQPFVAAAVPFEAIFPGADGPPDLDAESSTDRRGGKGKQGDPKHHGNRHAKHAKHARHGKHGQGGDHRKAGGRHDGAGERRDSGS